VADKSLLVSESIPDVELCGVRFGGRSPPMQDFNMRPELNILPKHY
jgi:hypothetical protein